MGFGVTRQGPLLSAVALHVPRLVCASVPGGGLRAAELGPRPYGGAATGRPPAPTVPGAEGSSHSPTPRQTRNRLGRGCRRLAGWGAAPASDGSPVPAGECPGSATGLPEAPTPPVATPGLGPPKVVSITQRPPAPAMESGSPVGAAPGQSMGSLLGWGRPAAEDPGRGLAGHQACLSWGWGDAWPCPRGLGCRARTAPGGQGSCPHGWADPTLVPAGPPVTHKALLLPDFPRPGDPSTSHRRPRENRSIVIEPPCPHLEGETVVHNPLVAGTWDCALWAGGTRTQVTTGPSTPRPRPKPQAWSRGPWGPYWGSGGTPWAGVQDSS